MEETNFEHLSRDSKDLARFMETVEYLEVARALKEVKDWLDKCKSVFDDPQLLIVEAICDKVRKARYENFEQQVGYMEDYLDTDPWRGHISIEGLENG